MLSIFRFIDHENLKDWHRRGMLPGDTSKGKEREYSIVDAVYAGVFGYLCIVVPPSTVSRIVTDISISIIEEMGGVPDKAKFAWSVDPISGELSKVTSVAIAICTTDIFDHLVFIDPVLWAEKILRSIEATK